MHFNPFNEAIVDLLERLQIPSLHKWQEIVCLFKCHLEKSLPASEVLINNWADRINPLDESINTNFPSKIFLVCPGKHQQQSPLTSLNAKVPKQTLFW